MALSDFVTVPISLTKQPVSRAGFGTPLILAADCPAGFTQRTRVYNTPDDLVTDGFAISGPTYKLASVLMDQDVAPVSFKVGRLVNKPTLALVVTPVSANTTEYDMAVDGNAVAFTSDGSATQAKVSAGLKTLIDALSLALTTVVPTLWVQSTATSIGAQVVTAAGGLFQCTASSGSTSGIGTGPVGTTGQTGITDGSVTWTCLAASGFAGDAGLLIILAQTAGAFHSVSVGNVDLLGIVQAHADPGVAADLAAIVTYDADFYGILNAFNSKAMALAIAVWTETQAGLKQFIADTNDSQHCTVAVGSATDLGTAVQTAAYNYTAVVYSPSNGDFLGAALCGLCLPQDAGSENWAMQTPTVNPSRLTATHRTNLVAKYVTFCEVLGGQNNTFEGKVGSGQYLDTVRFRAWLQVNIQGDVITAVKARAPLKLPMTDGGAHVVEAAILGVLKRGEKAGGLVAGSSSVTVPLIANVPSGDRTARLLSGVSFTAQLAGAINRVSPIKGQLTA